MAFILSCVYLSKEKRTKKIEIKIALATKFLSGSSRTCRSPLTSGQILVLHENYPAKSPIFLPTMRWNPVPFHRLRWKTWLAFDYKKIRDDLNTHSGVYGFVKLKNHENARKQSQRTPSVRTLGPCRAAMAKQKNLLRPSSFLLRRSPSNVRSVMPLHRLFIGLYDYQACSVSLKMDVYMHRLGSKNRGAKPQSTMVYHGLQINRIRGDDILAKKDCVYERDRRLRCEEERRLCVSVQCAGCWFFSPKLTKTSSIRVRLLLSLKRSSLSLYCLRDVWALTEKQLVSASLGVFRHEVSRTNLPRKKPFSYPTTPHDTGIRRSVVLYFGNAKTPNRGQPS